MKKLLAIFLFVFVVIFGLASNFLKAEEKKELTPEEILSAAENYCCCCSRDYQTVDKYEEIDVNEVFERLKKLLKSDRLENKVKAKAYLYQGSILANYLSTQDKGIFLFKKALTLEPKLMMCPKLDINSSEMPKSFSLFLEVVNIMSKSIPPKMSIEKIKYSTKKKQAVVLINFTVSMDTPYSGIKQVEFFYRINNRDWQSIKVSKKINSLTSSHQFEVTNVPESAVVDFYVTAVDFLNKEGYLGVTDIGVIENNHLVGNLIDSYRFVAKDGDLSAQLITDKNEEAKLKAESGSIATPVKEEKKSEISWPITNTAEDMACGDTVKSELLKKSCEFFCEGKKDIWTLKIFKEQLENRLKQTDPPDHPLFPGPTNQERADLYKYLASVLTVEHLILLHSSDNVDASGLRAVEEFLELSYQNNNLVKLCPNSPAFNLFKELMKTKDSATAESLAANADEILLPQDEKPVASENISWRQLIHLNPLLFTRMEVGRTGLIQAGGGVFIKHENYPFGVGGWGSGGAAFFTGNFHRPLRAYSYGMDAIYFKNSRFCGLGVIKEVLSMKGWQSVETVEGFRVIYNQMPQKSGVFWGVGIVVGWYNNSIEDISGVAWATEPILGYAF